METILTHQELTDWIMSQPDEREIDMDESTSEHRCGCIAIQYAKHQWGHDHICASERAAIELHHPYRVIKLDSGIFAEWSPGGWQWTGKYKEMKQYINQTFGQL